MTIAHIALRELRATFGTAIGWLLLCGWLFETGLFWIAMVSSYVVSSQDLVANPYGASQLTLGDYLLGPWFANCAVLLIMVVPALTMATFAAEQRNRTLELLLTSPVSTLEIVLGKYLGALGAVGILLAVTVHAPLMLYVWADPDPGLIAGGYLGLALLSAALVALGTFVSALTSNQLVAMVTPLAVALGLLSVGWLSRDPTDAAAQVSLLSHFGPFTQGEITLSHLAYYLGFGFVFVFATHQRMESFRWN
ncbi:MAG: ABC transporter permease [Myxococcota bacterium]